MTRKSFVTRRGYLLASVALASLTLADIAVAQTTDTNDDVEEVVVTGSRIRQNPLEAKSPVQILSAEDIEQSGQISIADFLQRLPIAGSAINRTNNSSGNLGFPPDGSGIGAGASEIDLRYLSSKRVLVLVDGRRWVRGSSASGVSGAVDLNTIPVGAIKSVEVLQDGASTIYGSDAIAGVINIKTSDNYDGFNASAYYGVYDEGDGGSQEYDVSWGAHTDRGRIFIDVSYTKQGAVEAGDREISAYPIAGVMNGASSGTPQGRFVFVNPGDGEVVSITPNNGAGLVPTFDPANPTGADFHGFAFEDRFNWQPFNKLVTPNERVNMFLKGEYDVTDNITYRVTAAYNNRRSVSQAAPEPLFFGPDGGGGFWMENVAIPASHPFNPIGVDLDSSNIIFFGRRPLEAGQRRFVQNVDTWYISNTVDGSFDMGDNKWYWDVNAIWAQNQANQRKTGAFNSRKLATALGDPAVCASIPGCVPINIFGGQGPDGNGSLTRAMLDYVTFVQKDESRVKMFDISANISGEVFQMPAGGVGVALGYNYREEEGSFVPDSVVSSGETAGVPASPTAGEIHVKEIYGEVNVPLLSDVGFAKRLGLTGAFRTSDYNVSGSTTVFKIGTAWQVNDDLTLRANWSEGFRAPNIGELFNTGSRFDASITDPCDDGDGVVPANCAALGVPPGFSQINPQLSVTTGGNRDLLPEEAETWTAGFTWSSDNVADSMGLELFTVEANYYNIKMTNAIKAPDAGEVLERCVNTLDPVACGAITRTATGTIIRIEGVLQNIAGIKTDGFDWSISANTNVESWGQLRLKWVNSHLFKYDETVPTADGFVTNKRAGTELGSPERAFVKWKSSFFVDWTKDDWNAGVTFRYVEGITEQCTGLVSDFGFNNLCSTPTTNEIPSRFYMDAQFGWSPEMLDGRTTFTVGIQNLLNTSTPICFSCDLNSFDGTLHPIPGRFFYGRVTFKM